MRLDWWTILLQIVKFMGLPVARPTLFFSSLQNKSSISHYIAVGDPFTGSLYIKQIILSGEKSKDVGRGNEGGSAKPDMPLVWVWAWKAWVGPPATLFFSFFSSI